MTFHAHNALPDHQIRDFEEAADFAACVALQDEVWGPIFNERVPGAILRTAQRLGGVAAGAFTRQGRLDGFVFGMTGWKDGAPLHWSDMLAVRPGVRDRGLGEALKQHQRDMLLMRGIVDAEWTFEPLESRNAWLNFARLGVVARQYVREYYEGSDSPLHEGLGTDRLVVHWRLDDRRVEDRLARRTAPPTRTQLAELHVINPLMEVDGVVACREARLDLDSDRLLLAIPADLDVVRQAGDPLLARWRAVTRRAFEHYLPRGWEIVDLVRDEGWSAYVLERIG
jgi:predicted GNAT superfamily acetyltransferase